MSRLLLSWVSQTCERVANSYCPAIVRLAEPIALTSIFPYAWALVKDFQIGDESQASVYSGILISAFSLAEAAMGMYWGALSDRIGRKPVLIIGSGGTIISMLTVGLASNFWVALFGRCLGGLLNGYVDSLKPLRALTDVKLVTSVLSKQW